MRLVLASASPRRAELLSRLDLPFEVRPGGDAELTARQHDEPTAFAVAAARAKAMAVARECPDAIVLAADTIVVIDNQLLHKPVDRDDAERMMRVLSGRRHEVMTAVVIRQGNRELARVQVTAVWFADLEQDTIDWYVRTGEPMDKAGGYGIQGRGEVLVNRIEGSWSNVVGLPLSLVVRMLAEFGVRAPGRGDTIPGGMTCEPTHDTEATSIFRPTPGAADRGRTPQPDGCGAVGDSAADGNGH